MLAPPPRPSDASAAAPPLLLRPAASFRRRIVETPPRYLVGGAAGMAAYLIAMRISMGANRPEQLILCSAVMVLAIWSDATRRFFMGMLPFLLFGIIYDLTHITQPLVRYLHVHVEEPYWFDRTLFGIPTPQGRLTPNEFFARHHWAWVDFVTGVSYIVFVYWSIGFAAYLALSRRGAADRALLARFGWTFLLMNVAGFATYYLYPAAPPWYVAQYGFGPANFAAHSSAAGAARWDELTGIPYFAGFYGRSADVFGAIPSLHVAYPLLTYLFGRELRKRWLDAATFALFLVVSFAAVYLNHHYVLDVLLGIAYTLTAWVVDQALQRRRAAVPALSAAPRA